MKKEGLLLTGLLIILAVDILLLLSAFLIRFKKAYWLISGFNTMSKEAQAKVDQKKMGNAVSLLLVLLAAIDTAGMLFLQFGLSTVGIICFLGDFPVILGFLISMQRYHKKTEKKQIRTVAIALGIVFSVTFVSVCGLLYFSSLPNSYEVQGKQLTVSGLYGETLNLSQTRSLELKQSLPQIESRTNGSSLGSMQKGSFRTADGPVTLFVDSSKPPFIYLNTGAKLVILNTPTAQETQKLYEKLRSATHE